MLTNPGVQPHNDAINVAQLQFLVEQCRTDLALRKPVSLHDGRDRGERTAADDALEQRLLDMVQRLELAVDKLARAVDERSSPAAAEVLAREADHRIKNNLQTVIALLHQQAQHADSEAVREALQVAGARVQAITSLHTALYEVTGQFGLVPQVDLAVYLPGLCAALGGAMDMGGGLRRIVAEVAPLLVSPKRAQVLGLIVTELATNALRHAFVPGRAGTVWVSGRPDGKKRYEIGIRDDGRGLPHDFDMRLRPSGLGLRVVNVLVSQAQGRLAVDGRAGTRFTLSVPRK